jgi:hypothetical protein
VAVGVALGLAVSVIVGVLVLVMVGDQVGVVLGVPVRVAVGVAVGVAEGVALGEAVGVKVLLRWKKPGKIQKLALCAWSCPWGPPKPFPSEDSPSKLAEVSVFPPLSWTEEDRPKFAETMAARRGKARARRATNSRGSLCLFRSGMLPQGPTIRYW